jgi:hypothetical protein
MAYRNTKLLRAIEAAKDKPREPREEDNTLSELMVNPEYLRHSSAIINDALKEGFDVLQLPSGDIVATGTKTIVHTYSWDKAKNKLVKARSTSTKPRSKRSGEDAEADAVEEAAEAE